MRLHGRGVYEPRHAELFMKQIAVIVPCFNHGEYLAECLDSLVAQTRDDWEAVIVDDGSTDRVTRKAIEAILYPKVRVVRHEQNQGPAAARNTGVRESGAPYVLQLDADDRLAPRYLEVVGALLDDNPSIDFAFPWLQCFGVSAGVMRYNEPTLERILVSQCVPGAGTLMRRTLWERIGGYCEHYVLRPGNEDWELWISAMERGSRGGTVQQALYMYRTHLESTSTRLRYREHETREFIYQRHRALFDKYKAAPAFLAEGYARAASASFEKGERSRAIRLALKSVMISPTRTAAKSLALSVSPSWVVAGWRRTKGRFWNNSVHP